MRRSPTCIHVRTPYSLTEPKPEPGSRARSSTDVGSPPALLLFPYEDPGVDDLDREYPWVTNCDDRVTLALVLDVGDVLSRHGYPAPTGATLVDLTLGLYRALHPAAPFVPPECS